MRLLYKNHRMPLDLDIAETERVRAWLARVTGRGGGFELTPIRGGASPRRFYRVEFGGRRLDRATGRDGAERPELDAGGGHDGTAIVMLVPPETPDVAF